MPYLNGEWFDGTEYEGHDYELTEDELLKTYLGGDAEDGDPPVEELSDDEVLTIALTEQLD